MRFAALALLAVILAPSGASATPCMNLVTQNALHFGWVEPGTRQEKVDGLNAMIAAYDWNSNNTRAVVLMIQEVMYNTAGYDPWMGANDPYYYTSDLHAKTTYFEAYGYAVDNNYNNAIRFVHYAWDLDEVDAALSTQFVRPPSALFVTCGNYMNPDENFWLLSIHTPFDSAAVIDAEIDAAADAMIAYLGCLVLPANPGVCQPAGTAGARRANTAIIGGDWNRNFARVDQHLCGNIPWGYVCDTQMNQDTSFNRNTANWSNPYDHFVVVNANGNNPMPGAVARVPFASYGLANSAQFVGQVSDHIGVVNGVDF